MNLHGGLGRWRSCGVVAVLLPGVEELLGCEEATSER